MIAGADSATFRQNRLLGYKPLGGDKVPAGAEVRCDKPCTLQVDADNTLRCTFQLQLHLGEGTYHVNAYLHRYVTNRAYERWLGAAAYRERPQVVPSKYDTFDVDVPAGIHTLTVRLLGSPGRVAEIHARIPGSGLENATAP